jgi:DnaJ family protein C protein 28
MQGGEFDGLPGAGKPLNLDDDPYTPEHLRMAHKMLRDHNMPPEWILESKALDEAREALNRQIARVRSRRQTMLDAAARSDAPEQARAEADAAWAEQKTRVQAQIIAYNRRALSYNLKVPRGVAHKAILDTDRMLRTL